MKIIKTIGNKDLLNKEKTLFLCSKRTPIEFYKQIFGWSESLSADRDCIACFNSTDFEAEMLKTLLVKKIPVVLFVMDKLVDVNNYQITQALDENRLLVVVLTRDEKRGDGATPKLRNKFVMSLCNSIVCGYINKNGSIFGLLAGINNVEFILENKLVIAAEEPLRVRWTVAEDKTLLRMFYEDMGIYAMHQQLKRPYSSIISRIRSITQSEDVLKGREFEDYVLSLFDLKKDGDIVLQEWQGDKCSDKVMPENNSNPDFVFRYDGKEFAVECKWRAFNRNYLKNLFLDKQIEKYKEFSKKRAMKVTVVIGLGGEPFNPEALYIIPLDDIDDVLGGSGSIEKYLNYSKFIDVTSFCE